MLQVNEAVELAAEKLAFGSLDVVRDNIEIVLSFIPLLNVIL